jgi:hypothetical protein
LTIQRYFLSLTLWQNRLERFHRKNILSMDT